MSSKKTMRVRAMCGRFARIYFRGKLKEKYRLKKGELLVDRLEDRYNVAPQQPIASVRTTEGERELAMLRWGLIPSWSKDPKIGYQLTNARAETIAEKPSFRTAFKQRRCMIPASGFYEWKRVGKQKQPFYIHPRGEDDLFSFAGLWESWHDPEGEIVESSAIITTEANELMRPIHDRMPVILNWEREEEWLNPRSEPDSLRTLLVPFASDRMEAYAVNLYVNNAKNQGPKCIEPMVA
jgi:putative SOS response-associated peptidase YedK